MTVRITQKTQKECAGNTEVPGYNDIGLYDTWLITSDILRYQLIPHF